MLILTGSNFCCCQFRVVTFSEDGALFASSNFPCYMTTDYKVCSTTSYKKRSCPEKSLCGRINTQSSHDFKNTSAFFCLFFLNIPPNAQIRGSLSQSNYSTLCLLSLKYSSTPLFPSPISICLWLLPLIT